MADRESTPCDNSAALLREAGSRIAKMEAMLADLHHAETRSETRFDGVKFQLRSRLTICYMAREILRRGRFCDARNLDIVLKRIELAVEHRRFRDLPPIDSAEIAATDLDDLSRRLSCPAG